MVSVGASLEVLEHDPPRHAVHNLNLLVTSSIIALFYGNTHSVSTVLEWKISGRQIGGNSRDSWLEIVFV